MKLFYDVALYYKSTEKDTRNFCCQRARERDRVRERVTAARTSNNNESDNNKKQQRELAAKYAKECSKGGDKEGKQQKQWKWEM